MVNQQAHRRSVLAYECTGQLKRSVIINRCRKVISKGHHHILPWKLHNTLRLGKPCALRPF